MDLQRGILIFLGILLNCTLAWDTQIVFPDWKTNRSKRPSSSSSSLGTQRGVPIPAPAQRPVSILVSPLTKFQQNLQNKEQQKKPKGISKLPPIPPSPYPPSITRPNTRVSTDDDIFDDDDDFEDDDLQQPQPQPPPQQQQPQPQPGPPPPPQQQQPQQPQPRPPQQQQPPRDNIPNWVWNNNHFHGGRTDPAQIPPTYQLRQNFQVEEFNKRLVMNFYQEVFGDKNYRAIEKYVAEDLIQHSPNLADGRQALRDDLKALFTSSPEAGDPEQIDFRNVGSDEDLVWLHVRIFKIINDKEYLFSAMEIFRVYDGLIVEHWDTVQIVPERAANRHPMF